MTLRINSWSGPRNVSTALMRSFGQRSDTQVVDEPLYGPYLAKTGAPHPALEELLEVLETDTRKIVDEVILAPSDRPVLFMKQMVHHLTPELDTGFLARCANILLVRDPAEVIASLVNQLPEPTMRDVGIERQALLFEELFALGQEPPVIDSRQLLLDPEHVLRELCGRLDLTWDPAMLSWPAGPRPEDGPWAPHWYENVWRSTGFAPYEAKSTEVPEHCAELLERCRAHYEVLSSHAIRARMEVS
jgi:hypothetical protein